MAHGFLHKCRFRFPAVVNLASVDAKQSCGGGSILHKDPLPGLVSACPVNPFPKKQVCWPKLAQECCPLGPVVAYPLGDHYWLWVAVECCNMISQAPPPVDTPAMLIKMPAQHGVCDTRLRGSHTGILWHPHLYGQLLTIGCESGTIVCGCDLWQQGGKRQWWRILLCDEASSCSVETKF